MPSYSRYSHHARRALTHASLLVRRFLHPRVDTGHLLVGVMLTNGSIGYQVLSELELEAEVAAEYLALLPLPLDEPPESPANDAALEAARQTAEGRAQITAETRVLLRRTAKGAESYRLSLDGRNLTARFGIGDALRVQRQRFDSIDEARTAYFERLATLATKGYLDATQE